MVKGYKRNIVLLKDTNSEIFDMAYFIMKDDLREKNIDIIGEANRILEENTCPAKRKKKHNFIPCALSFSLGAVITALVMTLIVI